MAFGKAPSGSEDSPPPRAYGGRAEGELKGPQGDQQRREGEVGDEHEEVQQCS